MQEVLDGLEWQMIHNVFGVVSALDDQVWPDQKVGWHAVEVAVRLRRQYKALRRRRANRRLRFGHAHRLRDLRLGGLDAEERVQLRLGIGDDRKRRVLPANVQEN